MKQSLLLYGFSAVIASSLLISFPSSAKTVKACEEEWKANKATIQASGKKKTDFMTECRAEAAQAAPAAAQPKPGETTNAPAAAPRSRYAKSFRACALEWTANKETLKASGKTRSDFITACRAGSETAAAPAAPPAGQTPATEAAPAKKTAKACEAEWKANKAAIQASGKKKTDFMTECRAEPASAQAAAPTPQPAPAQQEQPKSEVAAAPPSTPQEQKTEAPAAPAPQQPSSPSARGQYASEAAAKSHCPDDTVVWANTRSRVYHYPSSWRYGHTKAGAYMCEKDTAAAGIRAARREKRS